MRARILEITTVATLANFLAASALADSTTDQVLQVVSDLDSAWTEQDVTRCLANFTDDADFENSFGWTIQGRESIRGFLEWLFARYPRSEQDEQAEVRFQSTVQILSDRLALVDAIRETVPETADEAVRSNRTLYLLRKDDDRWRIWQMRIWEPKRAVTTPDVVAPSRFSTD